MMYFVYKQSANMHVSSSRMLNMQLRNRKMYFFFKRFFRNSTLLKNENKPESDHLSKGDGDKPENDHLSTGDEDKSEYDHLPKGKITVLEKKIHNDRKTSTVIEWKSAASAMRRLNFENKHLFGPLLLTKKKSKIDKTLEQFEIVQHETRIPIIETSIDNSDMNETFEINLDSILSFPLTNKMVHSSEKIEELNQLRENLERLCQNSFPSVTQILQKTMPSKNVEILNKWRENMISQLGVEGFETYQAALLANGSSLHKSISCYLSSAPDSELSIKDENIGHWSSLKFIFPNVKNVKLLEEFVVHPFLCYRGVIDCFAKYKNHLVVIDWKTSKKSKSLIKDTFDDPLQIAAYVGALNFDPKFQYLATKGLIVIAYENGSPATTHFIDQTQMRYYWNQWLKRVKEFWEMKNRELNNI